MKYQLCVCQKCGYCVDWQNVFLFDTTHLGSCICPDVASSTCFNDLGPDLQNIFRLIVSYLKFIIRSTYGSYLRRAKISLRNILS